MIEIKGDCYVVGDIHRETSLLKDVLFSYNIQNCTLILLGDIGIWKYRDYKYYLELDKFAAENNIMIYAFRGNHDNPIFFNIGEKVSPIIRRFWNKFTNFKPISDCSYIFVNGFKGIALGGGVSIDRIMRRSYNSSYKTGGIYKSNDWWKDETLANINNINEKFDFILSHTGPRPTKIAPLNENNCSFFRLDKTLAADIRKENEQIEKIQQQFKPKKWWFGHYHINDNFDYYDTRCIAVDIVNLSPLTM